MGFGKRIKALLNEKGKTVLWLSRETGIPRSTLYSIISRDSQPSFDIVLDIADTLNVDFEALIKPYEKEYDDNFSTKTIHKTKERNSKLARYMMNGDYDAAAEIMGFPKGTLRAIEPDEHIRILEDELSRERSKYSMGAKFLVDAYNKLNGEGKQEAHKRINELTLLPQYTKKDED